MTPEDRLRTALHDAAVDVPSDGLTRIMSAIAVRRARRRLVVPAVALACVAGVAGAFILIGGDGGRSRLVTVNPPASSSSPPPTALPGGTAAGEDDGHLTTDPPGRAVIWPLTSDRQSSAWQADPGARPWAGDPRQVAAHFLTDYLGVGRAFTLRGSVFSNPFLRIQTPQLRPPGPVRGASFVIVTTAFEQVGVVSLLRIGPGDRGPWSVYDVSGGDGMKVSIPDHGAALGSPTTVTGTVRSVDESVRVRLLSGAGSQLAESFVPAGMDRPWTGQLTWTDQRWAAGAVVATTLSPKDGALSHLAVVPVRRGRGGATAGPALVAVVDGHVVLADARTGQIRRQLSYPPLGFLDASPVISGSRVVWARYPVTGQGGGRVVSTDLMTGVTTTIVSEDVPVRVVALSPSGSVVAVGLDSRGKGRDGHFGSADTLVLRGGRATQRIPGPLDERVASLSVRDDGTTLIGHEGGRGSPEIRVFLPGAQRLADGAVLRDAPGCQLGASAWDGSSPAVWETCGSASRLVRFTASGARSAAGPLLPGLAEPPASTSINAGRVLVWSASNGAIARYDAGRLVPVTAPTGCRPGSSQPGCLTQPAW